MLSILLSQLDMQMLIAIYFLGIALVLTGVIAISGVTLVHTKKSELYYKNEFRKMESLVNELKTSGHKVHIIPKQTHVAQSGRDNNDYRYAIKFIKAGKKVDDIVEALGISRSEVEILSNLHKHNKIDIDY